MRGDDTFAANLRIVRQARGLTLAQLVSVLAARGLMTDQPSLSRMERGKRAVKVGEAVVISEVLGVALSDMVDPAGHLHRVSAQVEEMEAALAMKRQELADQILGGQR